MHGFTYLLHRMKRTIDAISFTSLLRRCEFQWQFFNESLEHLAFRGRQKIPVIIYIRLLANRPKNWQQATFTYLYDKYLILFKYTHQGFLGLIGGKVDNAWCSLSIGGTSKCSQIYARRHESSTCVANTTALRWAAITNTRKQERVINGYECYLNIAGQNGQVYFLLSHMPSIPSSFTSCHD